MYRLHINHAFVRDRLILSTPSLAVAEGTVVWVRTSEFSDCGLDFAQVCIPIRIICYCAEASRAAFPRQAMKPVQ